MLTNRLSKEAFSSSSHKRRQIFRYLCVVYISPCFCLFVCFNFILFCCNLFSGVSLLHAWLLVEQVSLWFLQHWIFSPFKKNG